MIDGRLSELEYRCGHRVFFGAIELELGHNALHPNTLIIRIKVVNAKISSHGSWSRLHRV